MIRAIAGRDFSGYGEGFGGPPRAGTGVGRHHDVTGFRGDPEMPRHPLRLVVMHMQGTPRDHAKRRTMIM